MFGKPLYDISNNGPQKSELISKETLRKNQKNTEKDRKSAP